MISFVQCQFSHRYVSFVVVFEVQGHGRLEYYYVFTFQTLICVVNSSLDFGEVNRHYVCKKCLRFFVILNVISLLFVFPWFKHQRIALAIFSEHWSLVNNLQLTAGYYALYGNCS